MFLPHWRAPAAALAVLLCSAIAAAVAPAYAADPAKVLRVAIPVAETGFDPQAAGDAYSNYVNRVIFDALYKYDYLARPFKLVPNTAAAMPDISADRMTWTMKVRPGIYFADDPVFRAGTASSPPWTTFIRSSARSTRDALEFVERVRRALRRCRRGRGQGKTDRQIDYDAPIEGAEALDRYTLRLQLNFRRRAAVQPDHRRQRRDRSRSRRSLR
jgi:ABC-type transport system substrate-binding protein